MDIKSYTRWDDYSRARNAMLEATDTAFAPWFVVKSDDKKRARLNVIAHMLSRVPYKKLKSNAEPLPKHRKVSKGLEPRRRLKFVPEAY
jgi:hypothetical protein